MSEGFIKIKGARQHNLKNISLEIPRNKLVVVTGISGSGKSSLAFDTIYAEGQRRYVESLSAYARQFLEQMEKPDVDSIDGLSPAIAIEQRTATRNPRSTVGTVTEIYDYLRLLFARIGRPYCPDCGVEISSQTAQEIVDQILGSQEGTRFQILSPLVIDRRGEYAHLFEKLQRDGFTRVKVDGKSFILEEEISIEKTKRHSISVVVDRISVRKDLVKRISDSVDLALSLSDGSLILEGEDQKEVFFSTKTACRLCGKSLPRLTPQMFSFNNPAGACRDCGGLGTRSYLDPDKIVSRPDLSLRQGALAPRLYSTSGAGQTVLAAVCKHFGADMDTPFRDLPSIVRDAILFGTGAERIKFSFNTGREKEKFTRSFDGVLATLQRQYDETESELPRSELEKFMTVSDCPSCLGARLNRASLSVRIGGKNIKEMTALPITGFHVFFRSLDLSAKERAIGSRILKEIEERLYFLINVGLGYLTLERSSATLSGGESQRIRLATQISSGLAGVLYVLDEPSIGLHQRDNLRLLENLIRLRELGNTVIVVEHDHETITAADQVIDMGPGAGELGGEIVFQGTPRDLLADPFSVTGKYLSGKMIIPVPASRRKGTGNRMVIHGARENNLKNITVEIPLGTLTCITGVSGSGKSSLINGILYPALCNTLNGSHHKVGEVDSISGIEGITRVINVDQSPIGRTPRSNPATYTGIFFHIRELFAMLPESRSRGYRAGRFSFNVAGGRCERCKGDGIIKIEMHFLPDVYVTCEACGGLRYNRDTLEVRYRGYTIADLLNMTVREASSFFEKIPALRSKLTTLMDVGLGYVRLGQQATTLSGGEAQRIKLARELSKKTSGGAVYLLDEPTTGLHFEDIKKLLEVLDHLVALKNTVLVIEHNLDVIKTADYVIDLGPEGGEDGGYVVAAGTPEQLASCKASYTGSYLQDKLLSRVTGQ
ncbi:MAG: excinuclease ABC subunit UvrA [Desulfobacteraceae bacterium]|nr:MAG: excinuclease ABC subunit UvrA [Desulfobacteraceae bacterium]